ncbi:phosphotransferase family protein [Sulfobacillus harzensis]|uniref:Phosphotransferase family protein n=1 Tax=Sulfobacillus harzensis TaxID=2729629 RepID=A0A7Y0Q4S3_9FIRM|nr:phosphotransferase family protein [Sulfobacillus harzensis]NMP23524.1 phosphotransferase family protein [Sulfobacillus harzensis]
MIPMRPGEELDLSALAPFLNIVFPGEGPWTVEQFAAGHSNLTYLLSAPSRRVVLRRPPNGPVAPRAHDMKREYQFLYALHPEFRWAPEVYALAEEDQSPLGVPFFLMEARSGVLVDRAFPYEPAMGPRISQVMVERLADLHQIDWRQTPLKNLVKPEGFMSRQVEGWIGRYQRAKTDEVPGLDALLRWLIDHLPESDQATVIHYDYKLDNVLFTSTFDDLTGVFDWEMATVGEPMADVAVAMSYWTEATDPEILQKALSGHGLTARPGFYSRRDWIEAYARRTGRPIRDFGYYLTFAYFKLAVILQQIYYRFVSGQTQDMRFAHFDVAVRQLLEVAMDQSRRKEG